MSNSASSLRYASTAILSLYLLSSTSNSEVLTYTNSTPPPSNVIRCKDHSSVCIINCDSSHICSNHELHCHNTSEVACIINLNADYAAQAAIIKTHSSANISINSHYQYAGEDLRVHAYDVLSAQLFVVVTGSYSLHRAYFYGPLGHNSLLSLTCGHSSCILLYIEADWSTTLRLEATGPVAFKQSQIRNLFDYVGSGLGITRADYGAVPQLDYRASVYLLGCVNAKETFAAFTLIGVNWGAYYILAQGAYTFLWAQLSFRTDNRVNQSVLYPVKILNSASSNLRRGSITFGAGVNAVIEVHGTQGLWYESIRAREANSLTINCLGGSCARLSIELPLNDAPNSFNWICDSATCYDNYQNNLEIANGYNCDNYYISSRVEARIYCGYNQTANYCELYPNHSSVCHPACGAECTFNNVVAPASITAEFDAYCSSDAVYMDTLQPTSATDRPSNYPTVSPTEQSVSPTNYPSANQTSGSSIIPTIGPSANPTNGPSPTQHPNLSPSRYPAISTTKNPTETPTKNATAVPTKPPTTKKPTIAGETYDPSFNPTRAPNVPTNPSTITRVHTAILNTKDVKQTTKTASDNIAQPTVAFFTVCIICCVCCCLARLCYISLGKRKHKASEAELANLNNADTQQNIMTARHERDIVISWLQHTVRCPQYADMFIDNGFECMQAIASIESREELEEIGVKALGHQIFILSEIKKLKAVPSNELLQTYETDVTAVAGMPRPPQRPSYWRQN
eukprot:1080060_1